MRHWRSCFDLRVIAAISHVRSVSAAMKSFHPGRENPRMAESGAPHQFAAAGAVSTAGSRRSPARSHSRRRPCAITIPRSSIGLRRMSVHGMAEMNTRSASSREFDACAQVRSDCHVRAILRGAGAAFNELGWASARRCWHTHPGSVRRSHGRRGPGIAAGTPEPAKLPQ
jgi:hypothetical protein